MDRKNWTVTLDGTEHEVMLLWTYWSGHREVLLDGKSVNSSAFPMRWRSEQPFDIAGHPCVVRTRPASKISMYFVLSLEVDGKEIPPNPGTPSQWERSSATT